MRKLILSMMVSIDGYIEDKNNDINWHAWDDEMEEYMFNFLDNIDTILFGRKTYSLLAQYWPDATESIAPKMNNIHKIVFSKSLKKAEWNNSEIVDNISAEKISELKRHDKKDMVLFGGAELASTLIKQNLFDEYRIIINPVILGGGSSLFPDIKQRLKLNIINTISFKCGNVILIYKS